jgi:sugar O-acyltransferase (sialic acid O-acetyltransferase NeuD family)
VKDLVILGAGGHAREILQCVLAINHLSPTWNFLGFLDDFPVSAEVAGFSVLGPSSWLHGRDCNVVVAVGSPALRRRLVVRIQGVASVKFATLIHPSAVIGSSVSIGPGCMISAGAILTADVVLGQHVIVNTGSVVSHDSRVADFCTIAPMSCLCGGVSMAEGAELGAGVTITPGITLGEWSMVGAGTTVIRDVLPNETVVGSPNRVIKKQDAGWHEKG